MSKTDQGLPIKKHALLVFPLKEKRFNNKKVKKSKKSKKSKMTFPIKLIGNPCQK
jgi:hypothetical protein